MSSLIQQSLLHRTLFSPTVMAATGEAMVSVGPANKQQGTGAAIAPGIIIMVEAVPTPWFLTPGKARTISGNKKWGKDISGTYRQQKHWHEPSLICYSQEVRQTAKAFKWFYRFVPWAADSELKISMQEVSEEVPMGSTPVKGEDKGLARERNLSCVPIPNFSQSFRKLLNWGKEGWIYRQQSVTVCGSPWEGMWPWGKQLSLAEAVPNGAKSWHHWHYS